MSHLTTELQEVCIPVADLRIGMFVCRLDRPWEGTPFPLQGVEVLRDSDVAMLREWCNQVFVDARREVVDGPKLTLKRTQLDSERFSGSVRYADPVAFEIELPRAQQALDSATAMIERMFSEVRDGRELSAEYVEQTLRPVVASVLRSPDVFLWVEGLRTHDSYTWKHAISCSVLAAAVGRHQGFAEDTIMSLAAGGLLMDVGKTRVSENILQAPRSLDAREMALARTHVQHGLDILAKSGITDEDVADIVRTHHERYDGSGYPDRLMGSGLPLTGRMLGLIDAYDAMTSVRPWRQALSRHRALRQIYAERDTTFQAELVEQFQVCLGVYPTGSMVELSTGEIAVVMAQNNVRRLRPKVIILSDHDKRPLPEFHSVDLMQLGDGADIARTLVAGDHGFDPAELFLR
jgi:HD-GYP domain-containing protein (c-di-GMP phosphodiesterase class II)